MSTVFKFAVVDVGYEKGIEGEPLIMTFTRVAIANWNQFSLLMWGPMYLPKNCSQRETICTLDSTQVALSYNKKKKKKKKREIGLKGKDKSHVITKSLTHILTHSLYYKNIICPTDDIFLYLDLH